MAAVSVKRSIIALRGELLLSKCNCILAGSYPLSPLFPFDHNYTYVGGSDGVTMEGWDLCSIRKQ